MAKNDDWFAVAAAEAAAMGRARGRRLEGEGRRIASSATESAAALEAFSRAKKVGASGTFFHPGGVAGVAAEMSAVAAGTIPMYTIPTLGKATGGIVTDKGNSRQISATVGLAAILKEIRSAGGSDAVFKAAGKWLTRATVEIGKITAEVEGDDDD